VTVESYIGLGERNLTADRTKPEWAEPLAPLPEWLKKVDALLDRAREPARPAADPARRGVVFMRDLRDPRDIEWFFGLPEGSYGANEAPATPDPEICQCLADSRARRIRGWRELLGLTPYRMARLLGYPNASDIRKIESGEHVPRSTKRQRALAERRCPEAAADRRGWIRAWRRRHGLTQDEAHWFLRYHMRIDYWRVEAGLRDLSWERLLVAIAMDESIEFC
jgi:hypothetical protein